MRPDQWALTNAHAWIRFPLSHAMTMSLCAECGETGGRPWTGIPFPSNPPCGPDPATSNYFQSFFLRASVADLTDSAAFSGLTPPDEEAWVGFSGFAFPDEEVWVAFHSL